MYIYTKLSSFITSFSILKVIFSVSLFILLLSVFSNTYAHRNEGHIGASCNADCCGHCPPEAFITYIYVSSPHRYNERGDNQIEEYAWVRDPY